MKNTLFFAAFLGVFFAAGCGAAVSVLPEPFTRERADGKIPVKAELIRKQVRTELDGTSTGEAEVARWQTIETDYNQCRLSSARATKSEAEEVFAVCMSEKGYVYMSRIDAEQFHDDIAFEEPKIYAAEKKAAKEERIAVEKRVEEERIAAAEKAKQERLEHNLMAYAKDGNLSEVRRLLADGVNPNAINDDGLTALMAASGEGHVDIVIMLLSKGSRPISATKNGITALMIAAIKGYAEIVRVLLAAGASPYAENDSGSTALIYAADGGFTEIVKMLLSEGVGPNTANKDGFTALMAATSQRHAEVVDILLAANANPNAKNKRGASVLQFAALNGYGNITEALLESGANPNYLVHGGYNLTDMVLHANHPEIVRLFRQHGGVCRKNC